MDLINWDAAGADTGFDLQSSQGVPDETNMDLVLGDIDGDDWSFWALQHFESTQIPQDISMCETNEPFTSLESLDYPPPTAQLAWYTPDAPCDHCAAGGYDCKRIQEGCYKGYCTSCVALRCECSLGPLGDDAGPEVGDTFPANPWPIMGDRPETSILHEDDLAAATNRTNHLAHLSQPGDTDDAFPALKPMGKAGARFSRESVRILKNWVSTHSRHPYPTEDEKEALQKITGLNKTQIANWLANARRRGKIQPTRATSPHVGRGYTQAIDIPQRTGLAGSIEHMNPLQRWQNSPPENEPASVTAIARAVTASSGSAISSSSGRNSPYISGFSDDGSGRSLCNQSSTSSFTNSHGSSGGSWASSHQSRGSFGSIPSFVKSNRGRRRRRKAPPRQLSDSLVQPLKTFQCTFCTETFRTKHDWQRHEKSLHLSLERWVCSPDGSQALNPETGLMSCVFCGHANPDEAHAEEHNFCGCTERTLEERTFYRKDHLRQHLKLVHNVKFLSWSMDKWRVSSPQIRSRCGFCGTIMDSWSTRVDHLAEHFKTGNTMADWKGDWGFDEPVNDMVENSIPPYLIHNERKSPLPYMASQGAAETPKNAYDLLKFELQYWHHVLSEDHGRSPTDDEFQKEACRILFGAEVLARQASRPASSWLRDLLLSRDDITKEAMYQPIRKQSENRMTNLRIIGKDTLFRDCPFENELLEFVKARQVLGLTAIDYELQLEACRIVGRTEERSTIPSEDVANWLIRLIRGSTAWLADFRKRAHLPRSEDIVDVNQRSKDVTLVDSTIHNYSRLDRELGEFFQTQNSIGFPPTDEELQRQARMIIYDNDDGWNQTAADDFEWLEQFKKRHTTPSGLLGASAPSTSPTSSGPISTQTRTTLSFDAPATSHDAAKTIPARILRPSSYFLNDANCYQRLAKGLSRFAASTMSVNNPNCHVPTDEELQHQARWIIYDDDDPWNQTAADNVEWLQRFKRDVGILPTESGPGLATDVKPWTIEEGGTGFAPPYISPNPQAIFEPLTNDSEIICDNSAKKAFEPNADTANHFIQSIRHRYPAPAKVFCARELENGLTEYVKREVARSGVMPSDDDLRERAKEILGMSKTAADDPVILDRFKAALMEAGVAPLPAQAVPGAPLPASTPADLLVPVPSGADMELTDEQVNDILDNINTGFENGEPMGI